MTKLDANPVAESKQRKSTKDNLHSEHICQSIPSGIARLNFPEKSENSRAHMIIQLANENLGKEREWLEFEDSNPQNGQTGLHASAVARESFMPSKMDMVKHASTMGKLLNGKGSTLKAIDEIQQRVNSSEQMESMKIRATNLSLENGKAEFQILVLATNQKPAIFKEFSLDLNDPKNEIEKIKNELFSEMDQFERNVAMAKEHNCREVLPPPSGLRIKTASAD